VACATATMVDIGSGILLATIASLVAVAVHISCGTSAITIASGAASRNMVGGTRIATCTAMVDIGINVDVTPVGLLGAVTVVKACVTGSNTRRRGTHGSGDVGIGTHGTACTTRRRIIEDVRFTPIREVAVAITIVCSTGSTTSSRGASGTGDVVGAACMAARATVGDIVRQRRLATVNELITVAIAVIDITVPIAN
jgi:hypothetical protein